MGQTDTVEHVWLKQLLADCLGQGPHMMQDGRNPKTTLNMVQHELGAQLCLYSAIRFRGIGIGSMHLASNQFRVHTSGWLNSWISEIKMIQGRSASA